MTWVICSVGCVSFQPIIGFPTVLHLLPAGRRRAKTHYKLIFYFIRKELISLSVCFWEVIHYFNGAWLLWSPLLSWAPALAGWEDCPTEQAVVWRLFLPGHDGKARLEGAVEARLEGAVGTAWGSCCHPQTQLRVGWTDCLRSIPATQLVGSVTGCKSSVSSMLHFHVKSAGCQHARLKYHFSYRVIHCSWKSQYNFFWKKEKKNTVLCRQKYCDLAFCFLKEKKNIRAPPAFQ